MIAAMFFPGLVDFWEIRTHTLFVGRTKTQGHTVIHSDNDSGDSAGEVLIAQELWP